MTWERYHEIGLPFGLVAGAITFIGAWIYCMAGYGFLFGFGLGWLPASFLAVIVSTIVRFAWPVLVLAIAALAAGIIYTVLR